MKQIALLLMLILLAGCDSIQDQMAMMTSTNQPTIIIPPGTKVQSGKDQIVIAGADECPSDTTILGSSPVGTLDCIAISKDRKSVPVFIYSRAGRSQEQWEIRRDGKYGERVSLVRPDGITVGPIVK